MHRIPIVPATAILISLPPVCVGSEDEPISFSSPTLKLTLEKIRPGFFRRVQRFVVSLSLSFSVSQSGRDVYAALMNGGGLLSPFRTNAVSHLSRITHSDESES